MHEKLQSYFTKVYEPILRRKPSEYPTADFSDGELGNSGDDEGRGPTYTPPNTRQWGEGRRQDLFDPMDAIMSHYRVHLK